MRRVFWCSDPSLRGCILRNLLEAAGARVLVPGSGVRPGTLRLPAGGSRFRHEKLLQHLPPGCFPRDMPPGSWMGTGDADLLAAHNDLVLVFEVKSRLVPRVARRAGAWAARLSLRYHLDEPWEALEAWRLLEEKGGRAVEDLLDKPSSIGELARSTAAVWAGLVGAARGLAMERVVVGAVLPFYARPLKGEIAEYVYRTAGWARECLGLEAEPLVLMVVSDKLGVPEGARLECLAGNCGVLPARVDAALALPHGVYGCRDCHYRRYCGGLFTRARR